MTDSQYLIFREVEVRSTKTKIWHVVSRTHGDVLGKISWFGRWRQYTFRPDTGTVWNKDCLADIQAFITEQMDEWKKARSG